MTRGGESDMSERVRAVLVTDDGSGRQRFYLARIHTWRFEDRTGPGLFALADLRPSLSSDV